MDAGARRFASVNFARLQSTTTIYHFRFFLRHSSEKISSVDLPRLRGHPEKDESAVGADDGETRRGQAADVFG